MDRMLYVAMNGAQQILRAQTVVSNNLANAATTGFRQDLATMRSQPVIGDGLPTRVYAMAERSGVDFTPGGIETTGRDLDVALKTDGYLAIDDGRGGEAYTRAGNLRIDGGGRLMTADGHVLLGERGPIVIPPVDKLDIAGDGTISILPSGETNVVALDRIKLVRPAAADLMKGADGLLRSKSGAAAAADASVQLVPGALEGSNVNTAHALVSMIELARRYETQVKLMSAADDAARSTDRLMSLS